MQGAVLVHLASRPGAQRPFVDEVRTRMRCSLGWCCDCLVCLFALLLLPVLHIVIIATILQVEGKTFRQAMDMIKASSRPLTLAFAVPPPARQGKEEQKKLASPAKLEEEQSSAQKGAPSRLAAAGPYAVGGSALELALQVHIYIYKDAYCSHP